MKLIKNIVRFCFLWPIYWLCKLLPKNETIWCFGAPRERFVDNSKYMFLYAQKHYADIKCYWVSDDPKLLDELNQRGFRTVKRSSVKGMWIIARAQAVFYSCFVSEVSFWLTSGAISVNLWHGLPLKKIEFDIKEGELQRKYAPSFSLEKLSWQLFNPVSFRRPDVMFAPTKIFSCIFQSAFRISSDEVVIAGSPRTDIFFEPTLDQQDLNTYPRIREIQTLGKKTYLYMPTFRDTGGDFFADAGFDFKKLNEVMAIQDSVFFIKAHPNAGLDDFCLDDFTHVVVIPSAIDPYPLMTHVDVLVTDYSSIYIDFLLLNKPIIFFAFDLANYLATCRDMYFEYGEVTPGKYVYNFEELLSSIGESDDFVKQRKVIKEKYLDLYNKIYQNN